MSLKDQFDAAVADSKNLPERPDNQTLLKLYALFKQATTGDVEGDRPGMTDFVNRAKWDAWKTLEGKTNEQAMQDYFELVEGLQGDELQGEADIEIAHDAADELADGHGGAEAWPDIGGNGHAGLRDIDDEARNLAAVAEREQRARVARQDALVLPLVRNLLMHALLLPDDLAT